MVVMSSLVIPISFSEAGPGSGLPFAFFQPSQPACFRLVAGVNLGAGF